MNDRQQILLDEILDEDETNPMCLHVLGQPLVDDLCVIIRELVYQLKKD